MIKLAKNEAQSVLGGAYYIWYKAYDIGQGQCVYTRMRMVEKDKFGTKTGERVYDGQDVAPCARGTEFGGERL